MSAPGGEDELRAEIRLALAQWVVVPLSHLGYIADALLPVVLADRERHARLRAAEELRYRAEGITSRATEADSEDVQVALDDEAARLHARADALTREATP